MTELLLSALNTMRGPVEGGFLNVVRMPDKSVNILLQANGIVNDEEFSGAIEIVGRNSRIGRIESKIGEVNGSLVSDLNLMPETPENLDAPYRGQIVFIERRPGEDFRNPPDSHNTSYPVISVLAGEEISEVEVEINKMVHGLSIPNCFLFGNPSREKVESAIISLRQAASVGN